jgi:hypothetical protein
MTRDVAYTYSEMNGWAKSLAAKLLFATGRICPKPPSCRPTHCKILALTVLALLRPGHVSAEGHSTMPEF